MFGKVYDHNGIEYRITYGRNFVSWVKSLSGVWQRFGYFSSFERAENKCKEVINDK